MTDLYTLGLEVRSDGVVVASNRLNQLAQSGKNAEGSTTKLSSATSALTGYLKAAAAAFGLYKLAEYAKDAALLAARYQTLGVVMNTVGATAGYTNAQMAGFEKQLQKQGIAMVESRQVLTQMAQAHLDLAKSSELARVAQDAATIGGINSSEAFERMVSGIQKGETEILKTIGINVNFEQSYVKIAATLGKSRDALSENEKSTARMNAVLERGKDIAGVYEAAMGTAGKQLTSMKRYMDNLKVTAGSVFNDILIVGVQAFTGVLKDANTEAEKLQQQNKLAEAGKEIVYVLAVIADGINIAIRGMFSLVSFGVAGFRQLYHGAESFSYALIGDFEGAKDSFNEMKNDGLAWMEIMKSTWSNPTMFQDATNAMYAQREANKAIEESQKKQLEQKQMLAGAYAQSQQNADALLITIEKNREEWNKIIVSQLESSGQYEAAAKKQIELNKLTADYKTLKDAAGKNDLAAAALRAQEILDERAILDAKTKQLETDKQAKLLNDQFAIVQQQIDLEKAQGLEQEAFEHQKVLDLQKLQLEYHQKMLDYQNQLNTATSEEGDIIRQNIALYEQMSSASAAAIQSRQYQAQAMSQPAIVTASGGTGYGSSWGWDANGNLLPSSQGSGRFIIPAGDPNMSISGDVGGTLTAMRDLGRAEATQTAGNFMFDILAGQLEREAEQKEQQRIASEQAAEAARQAAEALAKQEEATRLATIAMNQDLDVRELQAKGLTDQSTIVKLQISQQNELNKAVEDGVNTTRLLQVQQMEYANTIKDILIKQLQSASDAATAIFNETKSKLEEGLSSYSSSLNDAITSVNSTIKALSDAANGLRATASKLIGGGDTTLSPEQLYQKALSDYNSTKSLAMTGNIPALQNLGSVAEAFVSASRSYYGSSSAYAANFSGVQSDLASAASLADSIGATLQPQADLLEQQVEILNAIRDAIKIDSMGQFKLQVQKLAENKAAVDANAQSIIGGGNTNSAATLNALASVNGTVSTASISNSATVSNSISGQTTLLNGATGGVTSAVNTLNGTTGGVTGAVNTLNGTTGVVSGAVTSTGLFSLFSQYNSTYQTKQDAAQSVLNATSSNTSSSGTLASYLATVKDKTGNTATYTGTLASKTIKLSSSSTQQYVYDYNPSTGKTDYHLDTGTTTSYNYVAYAKGGIANKASIFGEAGPEAAVPLPDGRSIPVTLSRPDNYGDTSALLAELRSLRADVNQLRQESVGELREIKSPLRRAVAGR